MAEGLFRKRIKDLGLENQIYVGSRATSSWEVGNKPHPRTEAILNKYDAYFHDMKSEKIKDEDFREYDYIIGMDRENIENLKSIAGNNQHKIHLYLDVCNKVKGQEIDDPYYTHKYQETYELISKSVDCWIEVFKKGIN
ncbi:protein-tyrosine-phosphatase [Mariniplasma anaerobium]|uniref:protein-tyrosine-phosphatase n=2 Tax=Mariniplasma anaerobium TaxID=2735436 RepID=A0A7U9TKT3_9MOLU|nr:protein-tyrosine-phosphatase [Mariniplasma anaerobium]